MLAISLSTSFCIKVYLPPADYNAEAIDFQVFKISKPIRCLIKVLKNNGYLFWSDSKCDELLRTS